MTELRTKIGLEIHVQLKTKSKMFCGCDNQSFAKATDGKYASAVAPNTLVCPVCLGQPGSLPVANKQAIEWTVKTGLALNCEIPKTAKFDRKHYFYPDLPKGYQISQYDEPFATGGSLKLKVESEKSKVPEEVTVNLTRIHLEEDAGKLIHRDGKSLVDLNRAGTPLMEIVTEPEITSPQMAGDFLRKLQKIVRDVVQVSEASMEKGHLRCDANISVSEVASSEGPHFAKATRGKQVARMSPIIEIKNLNSFKFVEKALALVEEKLKAEHGQWPEKNSKETWGYDSVNNKVYLQRRKEEAADYRYFPEPDLPPVDSASFNLSALSADISKDEETIKSELGALGIDDQYTQILAKDKQKLGFFNAVADSNYLENYNKLARMVVNNLFGFVDLSITNSSEYAKSVEDKGLNVSQFKEIVRLIHDENYTYENALNSIAGGEVNLDEIINSVISNYPRELTRYKSGEKQLFGFFMGAVMKETKNSANPQEVSRILRGALENK